MKHTKERRELQFDTLHRIPKHILSLHGADNVCDFVLHDICAHGCFDLSKAAYFVDNPAFNCLKGVAGYEQTTAYRPEKNIWHEADQFSAHVQKVPFNQQVRRCVQYSCKNCQEPPEQVFETIAKDLGMNQFAYCSWDMKHENHGFLIYEAGSQEVDQELLTHALCLLGFCPIY